jgi:DNA excision repair protein ERCC-4
MDSNFVDNHSSGPAPQSSPDRAANAVCDVRADQMESARDVDSSPAQIALNGRSTRRKVARTMSGASVSTSRRSQPAKRRATMPADLSPEDLVAVIDSREQQPLDLAPLRSRIGTLATGDYSLRGLESVIAIERKSLGDLLLCVGQERDRFHREVMRLLAYPVRALVVESTWPELERGAWRSKVSNTAALGTVLNWVGMGLPVLMAANHERAGRYVGRLLFIAARRRWREARGLWPWCAG